MLTNIRSIVRRPFAPGRSLLKDERGLSTVEYVILLVLIAAACVGLWSKFGLVVKRKITDSKDKIDTEVVIEDK